MKSTELRTMLSTLFTDFNAYYGDNTGEMVNNYKINYQMSNISLSEEERRFRLSIDIWSPDNILVDNISDQIEDLLDYKSHFISKWATFVMDNDEGSIQYETLTKKTINYEVRTY